MYFAVSAMIVYEYIITFDREIQSVWQRKWTASSLLLVSTRWGMVANAIVACASLSPQNCEVTAVFSYLVSYVGLLQVAAFSALRVVGIAGGSYVLASIVLSLGMVPLGVNIFLLSKIRFQGSCNQILDLSDKDTFMVCLLSRVSSILADLLVIITTWRSTFRGWRGFSNSRKQVTVSDCLLRDGTIYFLALLLINAAQAITYSPEYDPVSALVSLMPLALINRFMLNLRQIHVAPPSPTVSTIIPHFQNPSSVERSTFSSILGNIGEPLVHGSDTDSEELGTFSIQFALDSALEEDDS